MAEPKRSSGIIVLLLGGAAIVGFAAYFQFGRQGPTSLDAPQQVALLPSTAAQSAASTEAPASPSETAQAPQDAPAEAAAAQPQAEAPEAPAFDEVRQESDGVTIIAGRATPGADVSVLLDGQEISQVTADSAGKFAAISLIAPDGEGHVLSLQEEGGSAGAGQIILAPLAPVLAAQADPQPSVQAPLVPADTGTTPANDTDQAAASASQPQDQIAQTPATPAVPEAAQEVAVLKTSDQGVELLNAPEVMSNVALDTISYSTAGQVQLAGRAQSQATAVQVYLNNRAVARLSVDDSGRWRGGLPDVDEGIYTLRVDEVTSDGTVTSRVETPFKREDPQVLAAAAATQGGVLRKITVQKGATLWAIAEARYGDGLLYVNVFKANESDIRDPDLIYPGQVFDLPD